MNFLRRLFNRGPALERGAYVSAAVSRHVDDPTRMLGNPLRNLTPARAALLFEQSTRGMWTQLQWLMHHAEWLDADLIALIRLRTGAIGEYLWQIQVQEEGDQVLAAEQKACLEDVYGQMDSLTAAIRHLEMALFRGYGHVLIRPSGEERWELEPLDTWWFVRDGMYGPWHWNGEAKAVEARQLGEESRLDPSMYLIREEAVPLVWLATVKFIRANFSQKWWDAFCEIVSQQSTVVIGPTGLSEEEADRFTADATAIARGGSGVLPAGSSVVFANAMRGEVPYPEHMGKLTRDLVKAAIGGTLAIETQSGSGTLAGEAHLATLRTIMAASAREISEVMQRQFDRRRLAEKFPGRPQLARFVLAAREESDQTKKVAQIVQLGTVGYQVDPEQVTEETGYRVTIRAPMAPETGGAGGGGYLPNRGPRPPVGGPTSSSTVAKELAMHLEVPSRWLQPVADLVAELETKAKALTDEELLGWLERAAARLPELFDQVDQAALAEVLEKALGAAALAGAESAEEATNA